MALSKQDWLDLVLDGLHLNASTHERAKMSVVLNKLTLLDLASLENQLTTVHASYQKTHTMAPKRDRLNAGPVEKCPGCLHADERHADWCYLS